MARGSPDAGGTGSHGALARAIPISTAWSSSSRSAVRMPQRGRQTESIFARAPAQLAIQEYEHTSQKSKRAPTCNCRAPYSAPEVEVRLAKVGEGDRQPFVWPAHAPDPGLE